jgi:hypothetical protein
MQLLLPPLNDHNLPWMDTIHPIVVHFVNAMAVISVVFDFIGVVMRRPNLFEVSFWNLLFATMAIFVAIIFGQVEAGLANPYGASRSILDLHIYTPNNREAHDRLVYRWIESLKAVEADSLTVVSKAAPTHPRSEAPLSVIGGACDTCRMGSDPATSVLNLEGRSHEVHNLWIVDASTLPSCPSVGIGLTVIANALRIGKALKASL